MNLCKASHAYRDLLSEHHLMQSMSRKGNCWDNACVESFFHSLKVEAIQYEPIMNRETMRQHVFEYIEIDYNKKRRHSALGYLSPREIRTTKCRLTKCPLMMGSPDHYAR